MHIFIRAIFSNSFTVNHPISLLGFGVYGSKKASKEYEVSIELSQAGKVLGSIHTTFTTDGVQSTFLIRFEKLIKVFPNVTYTASMKMKVSSDLIFQSLETELIVLWLVLHFQGPDSLYGTEGLREMSHGKIIFNFFQNKDLGNGTSVDAGQIP